MALEPQQQVLLYGFLAAVILGAVAHKTNFCTMGAVSDWINMGKKGRLWAWFTAIAVALAGVLLLEGLGVASVDSTLPPYRTANFAWLRYILGGVMFGIGMTLAGGCGNKTLLNIGGGNLKSLFVLGVAGLFAYLMTKTDFYAVLFHGWVSATSVNLADYGISSQAISDILGGSRDGLLHYAIGTALVLGILVMALRDKSFRSNWNHSLGGATVGLVVLAGWYITGGPLGQAAIEAVEWLDEKPVGVAVQSYTFINPMGESLYYLMSPGDLLRISFGVAALAGVILGSLLYAVSTGRFKLVWFKSRSDFINHLAGAVLMGIGGVLAMGCTIGQGISGTSTLALGSFLALGSIIFGSVLTMKLQYYRMMYDEEASFGASLLSVLADMHLLPSRMRRLDPP
ncbi:YeeE/YedE family protein [Thiohalobacter sp. IOR34]|uniref:YeeE/YedE family protein n=1 Tax=Thiohalobacter sp. IOR34 TaxID=3057176 RepID=UPI0025AFC5C6|nr:YeeE/YedE family protein [Thiohalobacter sp. IOR34]WJW76007.1 YeeE/YedE family protein [Thiohalobacter sp. IOR34]